MNNVPLGGRFFLVQASSTSWSGGPDFCMNLIDGESRVYWTVKRIVDNFASASVVIIVAAVPSAWEFYRKASKILGLNTITNQA
jgi:hypothetical protein